MHKLKKQVSQIIGTVTDFKRDRDRDQALKIKQQNYIAEHASRPNAHYNDIQLFDSQEGVHCITVVDHYRLAGGLESGRVIIWDISVGQQLLVLHNHQTAIKLLHTIQCVGRCTRLVSVSTDNLITLWDLGSGEMMKCFILSEDPNVRLVHHMTCPEFPDIVTLLFGSCKLLLSQIHTQQLQDPVSTDIIGRTNASDNILELLETDHHVICVSEKTVDIFEKECDAKGRFQLIHVDIAQPSDSVLYSCATMLSADKFAVGTVFGGVYIWTLNQKMDADFFHPFTSDMPVKRLILMNEEWLLVVYENSIHVVYTATGQSEYTQLFSSLLSVRYDPASRLILTASKESNKVVCWDATNLVHDKKSWARSAPNQLMCNGSLLAHCDSIQGTEVVNDGAVTFAKDSLVIVWRNKDAQLLKLFRAVQARDAH